MEKKEKLEKVSQERVNYCLPENIKESTELSENAKHVLGTLIDSILKTKDAQDSGILIISNDRLRMLSGIKKNHMLDALRELGEFDLIKRIPGKTRQAGESSQATTYHFNWDNICNKPLKRKTIEDLLLKYMESS